MRELCNVVHAWLLERCRTEEQLDALEAALAEQVDPAEERRRMLARLEGDVSSASFA